MGKYWKSRYSIKNPVGQKNNSILTNHNHIKEQFKDMQSKFLQNNKIQKDYASPSKAMKSLVPTKTRANTFFNNIWKVKYMWQFPKTQGEKRKLNLTLKNTSENCKSCNPILTTGTASVLSNSLCGCGEITRYMSNQKVDAGRWLSTLQHYKISVVLWIEKQMFFFFY